MTSLNLKLEDWMFPFSNLSDFLKALVIISKFNTSQINIVRKLKVFFDRRYNESSLRHFVSRVNIYPNLYGFDFWKNFSNIEQEVSEKLDQSKETGREFLTELKLCCFCKKTLSKDADILYNGRVYYYDRPSESCYVGVKRCKWCNAHHFLNYADVPLKGRISYERIIQS